MSGSKWKQKIIDGYLKDTGKNLFIPSGFLAWLKDRPDHEVYDVFYGMPDDEAAMAYRESLVRNWVSGLRITVHEQETVKAAPIAIVASEYRVPAMHSPVELRREGGGYVVTNPRDPDHTKELGRQAATALRSWVERYRGAANLLGVDISAIEKTVADLTVAASEQAQDAA